jgi:RNA polymerase sigma factor (sigma-70 family)
MTTLPTAQDQIPSELYKQFSRMLYKFVWKYQHLPAVTREDLLGEAHLIFCQAVRSFDPSRGASFSTHLYTQLESITHYITKQVRQSSRTATNLPDSEDEAEAVSLLDCIGFADPSFAQMEWSQYYKVLTPDAKEIVDWHRFGELDPPKTAKTAKKPLTAWSVFQRKAGPASKTAPEKAGWTWKRTQEAYSHLEEVLKEFTVAKPVDIEVIYGL